MTDKPPIIPVNNMETMLVAIWDELRGIRASLGGGADAPAASSGPVPKKATRKTTP
jgi:hypothetical protein